MWRSGIDERRLTPWRGIALAPGHWRVPASAMMAAWALAMLAIPPASAEDLPGLSGSYRVVAVRASSLVASPHDAQASLERNALIGTTVNFDEKSSWFDGSVCTGERVPLAAEPPLLWTADPNLSDLQVNPGEQDRRLNQALMIDCGARPLSSIKLVLIVDDRVVVATTSGAEDHYLVLETPLPDTEALVFEKGLGAAGFDPGAVDGVIDPATRAAVAAFAEAHGAMFRFETGVITRNLFDAVTSFATVVNATPEQSDWDRLRADTGFPLAGAYMITARPATGPASATPHEPWTTRAGAIVSFGPTLSWYDGQACADWRPVPFNGIPFDVHDPSLSDLMVGPLGERPNHRLMLLFEIVCDGDFIGSLVVIDRTVAVVPSPDGASFAILSAAPSPALIRRIQDRLRQEGLYAGEITGTWDAPTEAAAAAYNQRRGADLFEHPVLTLNLLDGLGVLD